MPVENSSPTSQIFSGKHNLSNSVKTFVATEIFDGKAVITL